MSADEDREVHEVRPEPPRFDELVRRPLLFSDESPFSPPGPIHRWFGSHRLRTLFRLGLIAAFGAVLASMLL